MGLKSSSRADLESWDFALPFEPPRRYSKSYDPLDPEPFPFSIQEILRVSGKSLSQIPDEIRVMAQRFQHLAKIWRNESAHLSSVREMVLHPAYQQIVGMGPSALPYIFAELERKPDHWFWALRAITEQDPVPPEHRGDVARMAQDWLQWAKIKGIRQ